VIVRILGEGRYDMPDACVPDLEKYDDALASALDSGDEQGFTKALDALIDEVRTKGARVPPDDLRTSSRVVPHPGSTIAEVKELLAEGS